MKPWREDLTGKKFGRLTVIKFIGVKNKRRRFWECICECGNKSDCLGENLKKGDTRSCGCLQRELAALRQKSHGESSIHGKTKEYRTWVDIKTRCYNEKEPSYFYYGGRGIKVCDRWLNSFENFLADIGRAPSRLHSIERIDVNKDYCPDNCKWATILEQANNKTTTVRFNFRGQSKSIAQWCRDMGLSYHKTRQRVNILKWDIEKALLTP